KDITKEEQSFCCAIGFRCRLVPFCGGCQDHSIHRDNVCEQHQAHDTSHMQIAPILDVQHVSKTYSTGVGPLTVLKDISFSLTAGTTCAIIGPSGSGKTTLLGLYAGLDRPSPGTQLLHG